MIYVKPQSPIRKGDTGIYPLTTYDQLIMKDGSRFNGENPKIIQYGTFNLPSLGPWQEASLKVNFSTLMPDANYVTFASLEGGGRLLGEYQKYSLG